MTYHPELMTSALKMTAALLVVLGGLCTVLYLIKRFAGREATASGGRLLRIIASSYIGVKKQIALVEVAGTVLVLGITPDHIALLTKIEDEKALSQLKTALEEKRSVPFRDVLQKMTARFSEDETS